MDWIKERGQGVCSNDGETTNSNMIYIVSTIPISIVWWHMYNKVRLAIGSGEQ